MENIIKEAIDTAIEEAKFNINSEDGGPFGCSIVKNDKIIAKAHNTVLKDKDPTCHAEMNAVREACKVLDTYDLSDCILVTTSNPCPMCMGGVQWSGIKTVVVCADKYVADQFGFNDVIFEDKSNINIIFCDENIEKKIISMFKSWQNSNGIIY